MIKYLLAAVLFFACSPLISQPHISFETIVSGLSQPVDAEEVNDGSHRLFIVERTGKIRIWNGALSSAPFLDLTSIITSANQEQGLLSLAFHPDYTTNGYFFVYYTNTSGAVTIARYSRTDSSTADPTSGVVLMTIPKRFPNHNGGNLVFGTDGYLYFGTGDGGSGGDPDNNAQNAASLLGKMIRIDVNRSTTPYYNIPADNPFAGSATLKQEIIATGLRNPWRWSFDKQTGDMWIADVGQDLWEEVNTVPAANRLDRNYGWSCLEASHVFKTSCSAQPNNVAPVFEYPHNSSTGGFSVTGGFVYRGTEYPMLQGYYLFTDYSTGNIWLTKPDGSGGWTTSRQANTVNNITSFSETADGTLYATTLGGTLHKVVATDALPVHLVAFSGTVSENLYRISWTVQNEEAGDVYVLEKRNDENAPFVELTRIAAAKRSASNLYDIKLPLPMEQTYYRLTIMSENQQVNYSNIISVNGIRRQIFKAYKIGKEIRLELPAGTTVIELYDGVGKLLKVQKTNPLARQTSISPDESATGILTIRALVNDKWQSVRVLY